MLTRLPAWFKEYLSRYKRAVAVAIGLGLIGSGCAALLMFTSGYLISATALEATTLFSILIPVAFVQLFGFGRPLARYVERLASHDWVLHVTSDLRLALYRRVEALTGDPAQVRSSGEYLGLLSDDVAHLQNLYLRVVFPTAIAYLLALGAAVLFGFFSVPFALIVLVSFAGVIVLLPFGCLLATRAVTMRAKAARAEEYERLTDDVFGAVDWVLAGRAPTVLERHSRADAVMRAGEASARLVQRSFSFVVIAALTALLCAVLVWAGSSFGTPGAQVNWLVAFALGFFPLIESFAVLPVGFAESTAHDGSLRRLDNLLGGTADVEGAADVAGDDGRARVVDDAASAAVELDGVSYAYPQARRKALDDLTLRIERGQSVAVLGRSGAGKSTFAHLVCGTLKPNAGRCLVCGADTSSHDVTSLVGYVGQTPYLFNRSLRANLTLGMAEVTDADLRRVLADVGLERKLASLPDGLDTVIGETGVGFSGGEAHRVAIARVLVADNPVVVVDEPFSALDPETEHELLTTLLEACAHRTLIVVTHHLAEIERFDRVVFIEDAHIDLDGSPEGLKATSSRFRDLVSFDRSGYDRAPRAS